MKGGVEGVRRSREPDPGSTLEPAFLLRSYFRRVYHNVCGVSHLIRNIGLYFGSGIQYLCVLRIERYGWVPFVSDMSPPATTTAPTHYEVLGIPPTASARAIRAAFHTHALIFHPDRQHHQPVPPSTSTSESTSTTFHAVHIAYECLRDPLQRRQYDAQLRAAELKSLAIDQDVDHDDPDIRRYAYEEATPEEVAEIYVDHDHRTRDVARDETAGLMHCEWDCRCGGTYHWHERDIVGDPGVRAVALGRRRERGREEIEDEMEREEEEAEEEEEQEESLAERFGDFVGLEGSIAGEVAAACNGCSLHIRVLFEIHPPVEGGCVPEIRGRSNASSYSRT